MAFLENHFETEGSEDAATAGTYDVMRETERIVEESLLRSRTDEPTEVRTQDDGAAMQ